MILQDVHAQDFLGQSIFIGGGACFKKTMHPMFFWLVPLDILDKNNS